MRKRFLRLLPLLSDVQRGRLVPLSHPAAPERDRLDASLVLYFLWESLFAPPKKEILNTTYVSAVQTLESGE